MNRRQLLKLFAATGVVGAVGGMSELEKILEPMRAIAPADSGHIVAKGVLMQWGISNAGGTAIYPVMFTSIYALLAEEGVVSKVGVSLAQIKPNTAWVAWGIQ